jgi:hypothetical protein
VYLKNDADPPRPRASLIETMTYRAPIVVTDRMFLSIFHRSGRLAIAVLAGRSVAAGRTGELVATAACANQPVGVLTEIARQEDFAGSRSLTQGQRGGRDHVEGLQLVTAIRFARASRFIAARCCGATASKPARTAAHVVRESQSQYGVQMFCHAALSQSQPSSSPNAERIRRDHHCRVAACGHRDPRTFRWPHRLRRVEVGKLISAGTIITTLTPGHQAGIFRPEVVLAVLVEACRSRRAALRTPSANSRGR